MAWAVITPPSEEPVTLTEAKLHLREDGYDLDSLITAKLLAARQHVETVCERAIMPQVWALYLDAFATPTTLPGGLIRSITSVEYVDTNGDTQTLADTGYQLSSQRDPARLMPAYGTSWPSTRRQMDAVTITYACGYTDAASVPSPLKSAILLLMQQLLDQPDASPTAVMSSTVRALLWPYRRVTL